MLISLLIIVLILILLYTVGGVGFGRENFQNPMWFLALILWVVAIIMAIQLLIANVHGLTY